MQEKEPKINEQNYSPENSLSEGLSFYEKINQWFDQIPMFDGVVDTIQFELIGHGGSHDVYQFQGAPEFVYKLKHGFYSKLISNDLSEAVAEEIIRIIDLENKQYEALYSYFEAKNCLREYSMMIPTRIETYAGEYHVIDAIVNVQEMSEFFDHPTKLNATGMYIERGERFADVEAKNQFDKINRGLFGEGVFDIEDYVSFDSSHEQYIREFLESLREDEGLQDAVRDFLTRFAKYYEETGNILDLIGSENVIFYRTDDGWEYQLGSVIKGSTRERFEEALRLIEIDPSQMLPEVKSSLLNGLAVGRYVNALAHEVGMRPVFDVQLSEAQIAWMRESDFSR